MLPKHNTNVPRYMYPTVWKYIGRASLKKIQTQTYNKKQGRQWGLRIQDFMEFSGQGHQRNSIIICNFQGLIKKKKIRN